MKKSVLVLTVIITVSMLCSCADFNAGKRPCDQNNTRWVSENPDIYFEVNEKYEEIK